MLRLTSIALVALLLVAGCGSQSATPTGSVPATPGSDSRYPDVVAASAQRDGDGAWTVSATVSSPYDSPDRYADAWRVLAPDGTELGIRTLAHDHAGEQPFTRSLVGVRIPAGVEVITVEGRDQVNGWGGATVDVALEP